MTSNILIWKCQLLLWTYVYARTQGKVSHSPRPPGHSWDGLYVFVWRWTFRCSALIWCLALSKTGRIPDLRISEYTQSSKLCWRMPLCSLFLSSYVNPISDTQKGTCFLTECPHWLLSYQHLPSGFSPKSEPESPGCPCPHLAYVAKEFSDKRHSAFFWGNPLLSQVIFKVPENGRKEMVWQRFLSGVEAWELRLLCGWETSMPCFFFLTDGEQRSFEWHGPDLQTTGQRYC